MAGPLVYIGRHRIKEGQFETAVRNARDVVALVREQEPQLIAFDFFLSSDETEVTVTQVHPDVASMYTHMRVIREHLENYGDYLEILDTAVYGESAENLVEEFRRMEPDVPIDVKSRWLGGLTGARDKVSAEPRPAQA